MKQLLLGIVLLILLGIAGFLYRNIMERPYGPGQTVCTADARICPDGTGVGRTGPSCEFAPCAFPSIELANIQLAFAIPPGYQTDENAYGAEPTLQGAFVKPSLSENVLHTIIVRQFLVPEGQTANEVIIENTRYQPSDMPAEDLQSFTPIVIGGKTYMKTTIERFEALVHSAYYLPRSNDVLRFEIVEHDVTSWTDPNLIVEDLPEHHAFIQMLETVQSP